MNLPHMPSSRPVPPAGTPTPILVDQIRASPCDVTVSIGAATRSIVLFEAEPRELSP